MTTIARLHQTSSTNFTTTKSKSEQKTLGKKHKKHEKKKYGKGRREIKRQEAKKQERKYEEEVYEENDHYTKEHEEEKKKAIKKREISNAINAFNATIINCNYALSAAQKAYTLSGSNPGNANFMAKLNAFHAAKTNSRTLFAEAIAASRLEGFNAAFSSAYADYRKACIVTSIPPVPACPIYACYIPSDLEFEATTTYERVMKEAKASISSVIITKAFGPHTSIEEIVGSTSATIHLVLSKKIVADTDRAADLVFDQIFDDAFGEGYRHAYSVFDNFYKAIDAAFKFSFEEIDSLQCRQISDE
jgi:hypothetical protein